MKNKLAFNILAIVLLLTSCKKDNITPGDLEGMWEMRRSSGMITIDYPPGTGQTIKFSGNTYEMGSGGQVLQSGTFRIIKDPGVEEATCLIIPEDKYENRIVYDHFSSNTKIFFQLNGDSLHFISGCFAVDGGSVSEFVRK